MTGALPARDSIGELPEAQTPTLGSRISGDSREGCVPPFAGAAPDERFASLASADQHVASGRRVRHGA